MMKDEEIQMSKDGEGETSLTNEGTDQSSRVQGWLISIAQWDPSTDILQKAKIPLVPSILREFESYQICYDPQVVSIGPYHHGKLALKQGEQLKTKMASQFMVNATADLNDIFQRVLDVSQEARTYYVECNATTRLDDKEFAMIMFLDGCFLIQYMVSVVYGLHEELNMSAQYIDLVSRDLLLVENQLPFVVLETLAKVLPKLFFSCTHANRPFSSTICYLVCEMYRNRLNPFMHPLAMETRPLHFLDIFREICVGPKPVTQNDRHGRHGKLEAAYLYSAKKLQSNGVKFKTNNSMFLTDIHFNSGLIFPHLSLPQIVIDESTKAIFLNMIAYEMAKENDPGDYRVNDFICFMNSLINDADDVKILKSSGILCNALGSDEQVAHLFNYIARNSIPSPDAYRTVKHRIQREYGIKSIFWFVHEPWRMIALIAVVIHLVLTLTQTIFVILARGK